MTNQELAGIVRRFQNGDTKAFDEFYRATQRQVFFHAMQILKDESAAEDAVQDAYIAAFEGLGRLRAPMAAQSWINRTSAISATTSSAPPASLWSRSTTKRFLQSRPHLKASSRRRFWIGRSRYACSRT